MANLIKIRRGLKTNLPILARGELGYATDTNELFIGVLASPTQVSDNVLINDLPDLSAYYTKSEIEGFGGTGLTWNASTSKFDIDSPFDPNGNYSGLRAQATTAEDVGLENVTNESKATMFTNPTFTGTVTISAEATLTGVPLPTDNNDAANKSYVDQLAQGIKARSQALVLVGTPLAGTYDSEPPLHEFEADANGAFPAVDGVSSETLNVIGSRIVLAAQSNAAHNGLYVLKTVGDSETKWVLRRCTQCDTSEKIPGSFVFVTKGTNFENTGWLFDVVNPLTFTLGTDAINVIQFSGAGTFTAGAGLDLTGTEFSVIFADIEEAEEGEVDNKLMTPETTAAAIEAQVGATLISENYVAFDDLATTGEAEDGVTPRDDVWMSPLKTQQAIAKFADENVIEVVQAEGTPLSITNKTVNVTRTSLGAAFTETFTTTLDTTWTGSSAPFTKTQTVSGILSTDNPIVDVVMSGTFNTDETRAEQWGQIYRITTANNSITLSAFEKPTVSLPIQIKVVR